MLPDFPALKAEVQKIVFAKLRNLVDGGDPVLAQIKRRFTQHEGLQMRYEQYGGTTVEQDFEQIGTKFEVPIGDVPYLTGEKLDAKLREIARGVVSQLAKSFFKKLGETCDKAGTTVDAKGQPVSPELLLEMISGVQAEFDSDGNPTQSFVIHPDMLPAMQKIAQQIENDPDLKQRHAEILDRQRTEWAAREGNRKLVD